MMYRNFLLLLAALCTLASVCAQEATAPDLQRERWPAEWVTVPGIDRTAYGVYLFRKQFGLATAPDTFPILISADNQYELFVNGEFAGRGPAHGDLDHWYYDTLDLADHLQAGDNTLAVRVWNAGEHRKMAQISYATALIVQAGARAGAPVSTDTSWRCRPDPGYRPVPVSTYGPRPGLVGMKGYYVAGPGDRVDMARRIRNWSGADFEDANWSNAAPISRGVPKATVGMDAREPWRLLPSPVPQMERTAERFAAARRMQGVEVPEGFLQGRAPLVIPPNTEATLLLDQSHLTNAFPTFTFSGGAGARVRITYAEALYEDDLWTKGNRNQIERKVIVGRQDTVFTDGSENQVFTPLSYRTYRYVQIDLDTGDEPLTWEDVSAVAVGYPFDLRAKVRMPEPQVDTLLEVGWRTARLCAMDTYMDCPYWEQLQYIGDTRIQALVTLYNTGDDQLVKHALDLMDMSRQPEGVTLSRYPTNLKQIIGPFSLWYVGMLHDYLRYGSDREFLRNKLAGMRQVLNYFHGYQDTDGSLRHLPNWSYTDWVKEWPRGVPPLDGRGHSAVLDLQLLLAYRSAQALEEELGMNAFAELYRQRAEQLGNTILKKYWNGERSLLADNADHATFSQHASSLAILAGLVPEDKLATVGQRIMGDESLTPASIYFRYYVHRALVRAGMGDDYLSWLDVWRENLSLGLTTWAEQPDPVTSRSDCHAWGSSPNIEVYRTILGIDSASPFFRTVRIEPHLGNRRQVSGRMPHPDGMISVSYDLEETNRATIELPAGITGTFVWRGKELPLKDGRNSIGL
jgi:hypothetical protein